MLSTVLVAAQTSVPLWAWAFFVVALLAMVVVASVAMQRAKAARSGGGNARPTRGLTPEQRAFQEEMRVMLEARLHKRDADEQRPAEEEAQPPPP